MPKKSVIIDFDNTIGYFEQLIYLINIVEKTYENDISNKDIFCLLDNYPYVFRPKLFEIFKLVNKHRKYNNMQFFILYTSNKQENFVHTIVDYLKYKFNQNNIIDYTIFEKSKVKSWQSLKEQMNNKINENNILCFIDDKYFDYNNNNDFFNKNLKYITCECYIYNYKLKDILKYFPYNKFKLISSNLLKEYFKILNKRDKEKKRNIELPHKAYEYNSNHICFLLDTYLSES